MLKDKKEINRKNIVYKDIIFKNKITWFIKIFLAYLKAGDLESL